MDMNADAIHHDHDTGPDDAACNGKSDACSSCILSYSVALPVLPACELLAAFEVG